MSLKTVVMRLVCQIGSRGGSCGTGRVMMALVVVVVDARVGEHVLAVVVVMSGGDHSVAIGVLAARCTVALMRSRPGRRARSVQAEQFLDGERRPLRQ